MQAIRIIKPWQTYKPGAVIYPTGTVREWLVARGIAELVKKRNVHKKND